MVRLRRPERRAPTWSSGSCRQDGCRQLGAADDDEHERRPRRGKHQRRRLSHAELYTDRSERLPLDVVLLPHRRQSWPHEATGGSDEGLRDLHHDEGTGRVRVALLRRAAHRDTRRRCEADRIHRSEAHGLEVEERWWVDRRHDRRHDWWVDGKWWFVHPCFGLRFVRLAREFRSRVGAGRRRTRFHRRGIDADTPRDRSRESHHGQSALGRSARSGWWSRRYRPWIHRVPRCPAPVAPRHRVRAYRLKRHALQDRAEAGPDTRLEAFMARDLRRFDEIGLEENWPEEFAITPDVQDEARAAETVPVVVIGQPVPVTPASFGSIASMFVDLLRRRLRDLGSV